MSKWSKDAHKRVAKSLGYVLTQGTESAWRGLTIILMARLTEAEIVALINSGIQAIDHDTAYQAASAALSGAGQPIAPLFNHMDEATFWADIAEPDEKDAYCLASFEGMAPGRQDAFLEYVRGRAAA